METSSKNHIGRKILRIRELKGMKQDALAFAMGVSQQTISNIENSEEVDEAKLKKIAEALGVSAEAIRNFSEEGVINYFNTFNDNSSSQGNSFNQGMNPTFNPLDKLVEVYEENKRLYERIIQLEKERGDLLERMHGK